MLSDRLSVRLQDQCDLEYLRQKTGMSSGRSKTVARISLAFIGGSYVLGIGIRVFQRRTEGRTRIPFRIQVARFIIALRLGTWTRSCITLFRCENERAIGR